jgi:hypothetical protein
MKLGWAALLLVAAGPSFSPSPAHADPSPLLLFVDRDDDDDDGIADGRASELNGKALADVVWVSDQHRRAGAAPGLLRWISGKKPWAGAGRPPGKLGVQALSAGRTEMELGSDRVAVDVIEVLAIDWRGNRIDLATSHAAVSRVLPTELEAEDGPREEDPDALRWVLVGPSGALPGTLTLRSERFDGRPLDALDRVELAEGPCPDGVPPDLECRKTALIRATGDRIDRTHPESSARSLRAEVGGRIALWVGKHKAASIRVGGPRVTAVGQIGRLRGSVRLHVMRLAPSGMPAIGGDETGALALAREEIDIASGLWGQCGIHFGGASEQVIAVHDPPPPHLLAVGCDLGLPASGGELKFAVDGRRLRVSTSAGQAPVTVAGRVARALTALGYAATVSVNARVAPAALPTVDVLVRRRDGSPATLRPDGTAGLSSDATLGVCIGEVNLADGLSHFSDADAASGTLEERTLIKAFIDDDPTTIDIFVVPAFAGAGRIGESFIDGEQASIQNVVILDRAGIRAGARSYALAHELGHILLDMPGHPDDFGVDRPSALMDADAADPSIFGPRRLSVSECERAILQSGPSAPLPLLQDWPLFRAKK